MTRRVLLPPDEAPRPDGIKAGGWWHTSEDKESLVCDLCPRGCHLKPGKRGFCFVRQNLQGRIVLTTYGRSTGFCIDPIEKKPLNHFYPGTSVLSFGTAGCNLGCKFCQNWSMSKSREVESLSEVAHPEAVAEAARQHACRSVAFTYNDPIIWAEYATDTARACRGAGIKTVAVTSGYMMPEARKSFYEVIDAANVDLKGFADSFYFKLCSGHLQPVLDTIRWLVHETDVWVELTNLIIPDANDSPDELRRMCVWIAEKLGPEIPVHFSAFHPDFRMRDRPGTAPETLLLAYDLARQAGLRYVYTGNISHPQSQSTYCSGCGQVLIERDGYRLGVYALERDRCRHCDTRVAGRFDERPGAWGPRRQPVRISAFRPPRHNQSEPKGEVRMDTNTPQQPLAPGVGSQRPQFTDQQENLLFQAAGRRVAAAVKNQPGERLDEVLEDLGRQPLLGAFVSLKRSGQLRSCCGFLGESVPLHQALDHAAVRAAREDPRFPPISLTELDHLDMEVWFLWGLQPVAARGEDRANAVTIGKHGLQIARGQARGLLLPGVAVDHKLDARGFLEQVCRKAGLPAGAWKDDDTTLMTFEGYAIAGPMESVATAASPVPAQSGPSEAEVARLADFCRQNLIALNLGATPTLYLPNGFDGGVNGVAISVKFPGATENIDCSRVALRPEMPLQSTLFDLTKAAVGALQARRVLPQTVQTASVGLTVFSDPAMHGTVGDPKLEGIDPRRRAVILLHSDKWAVAHDPKKSPRDLLQQAVEVARLPEPSAAAVCSLNVVSTEPRIALTNVPRPRGGPAVRAPAVAGRFYPGDPAEVDKMIDDFLPDKPQRKPWAAAMVPHAGWIYSGRLAAEVFSRVEIPELVIVVAPKHTRPGPDWSVAPHRTWSLPGRSVESNPQLAQKFADAVTGLELDAAAHAGEHAIEVHLPLIARLAPSAQVVGMTIHGGGLSALQRFADQWSEVLRSLPTRPLLVISSDMNHYADEEQTRRLDRMALDALKTLDPAQLHQTVTENRISMCGVLPTVLVMETLKRLDSLNRFESVGYTTSAQTSGDTGRVVGYAGMLFE
jgi:AmmeMemoRadiSam system radical SAM enzyme/AmmeMemoRadiSam system protein B/AmmeMemoRadiSam system protein A